MNKHIKILTSGILLLSLIVFAGCNAVETKSKKDNNDKYTTSEINDKADNTEIQYNYLEGYKSLELYQEIEKIEQCTSPDTLCNILKELYGEEIYFTKIEYNANLKEYEETGGGFIFQVAALYDVHKSKAPIKDDVFSFFKPYSEMPVFIMDSSGSYPVGSYEIKNFDDGTHAHCVNAWSATDLFLCLHSFSECNGDEKQRNTLSDGVRFMDWYMEYEARVLLNSYEKNANADVFSELKHQDSRAHLLIPIMDGTLSELIDDFVSEALKVCNRTQPSADMELLYSCQSKIIKVLNSISEETIIGENKVNDNIWNEYSNEICKISHYIEEIITFANDGYNDKEYSLNKINEYQTMCNKQSEALQATVLFLKMK